MATLEELFPLEAGERPLRFKASTANPAEVMHQELQRLAREHRAESDRLLAALAVCCFQLRRVAEDLAGRAAGEPTTAGDALAIIGANLGDLLEEYQVRMENLTGQPWTAESRNTIDLRGHTAREDLMAPRVVHMETPVIYRGDRLLARGAALIEVPKKM